MVACQSQKSFIQDQLKQKQIFMFGARGESNVADLFTKPLSWVVTLKHMWGLGLRDYASAACMLDGFVALCGAMLVGKGHVSLHDRFTYVGDLVHDGYLAMWQLANSYYEAQIYASGCGNFGSNATLPFAYDVGRCTQGVPQNSSLRCLALWEIQWRLLRSTSPSLLLGPC